jgi:hypothetical protein
VNRETAVSLYAAKRLLILEEDLFSIQPSESISSGTWNSSI